MTVIAKINKNFIKSMIISCLMLTATTTTPMQLFSTLNQFSSYVQQRLVFAKVFIKALWNHATQTSSHIAIEAKLAKLYEEKKNQTPQEAAQELRQAIEKNKNIIKSSQYFYLGASTSALQVEGGLDDTSATAQYYINENKKNGKNYTLPGKATDFENNYEQDLDLLKSKLYGNTIRISIAWNRIEPTKDGFSEEGITFYKKCIQSCIDKKITPIIAFLHYDVPRWFADMNWFEKAENEQFFVRFVLHVYKKMPELLGQCILSMNNSPEGAAFKGYFTQESFPGKKDDLHMTHTVIANMYHAIVESSLAITKEFDELTKQNSNLKKPYIGTQINVVPLDPHPESQTTWKDRIKTALGCAMGTYIQSGAHNFLVNGEYRMFTPNLEFMKTAKGVDVYHSHPRAHEAFEWIGVNTYSNNFLNGFDRINNSTEKDKSRITDNPNYRNYPEGIYRAVQMVSDTIAKPLGEKNNKDKRPLPIIITENGIATNDDEARNDYYKKAFATITQLQKDKYRVEGYTPWSLTDTFEWGKSFGEVSYGHIKINFNDENLTRTHRKDSYFAKFNQEFFKKA